MALSEGAALQAALAFGGAVAVCLAVAIITYYLTRKYKGPLKELELKPDNTVCYNGINYRYDPETKSIVESVAPVTVKDKNDSNNNLRKLSPNAISALKKEAKNSTVTKEVQTDPVESINFNNDDTKIFPHKAVKPMSVEEKVSNYLGGGIQTSSYQSVTHPEFTNNLETLSISSSSNFSNFSSEKSNDSIKRAYKKRIQRSIEKYVSDMMQQDILQATSSDADRETDLVSESSDISSTSSNWSNISSIKSTDDFNKAYKKQVRKTLKHFVSSMSKTSRAPSECSEESEFSIISQETEVCKTCKTNHVNSCMQPCMHRYLCSDCATKIFELYKRCKVCRAKIERIAVEE